MVHSRQGTGVMNGIASVVADGSAGGAAALIAMGVVLARHVEAAAIKTVTKTITKTATPTRRRPPGAAGAAPTEKSINPTAATCSRPQS